MAIDKLLDSTTTKIKMLILDDDELYEICYYVQIGHSEGMEYAEEDQFLVMKIKSDTSCETEQRLRELAENVPFILLRQSQEFHQKCYNHGCLISSPVLKVREELKDNIHARMIEGSSTFINIQDCTQSLETYRRNLANNKYVYEMV